MITEEVQNVHGGLVAYAYLADPDGYVVEIQYGSGELPVAKNPLHTQEGDQQ